MMRVLPPGVLVISHLIIILISSVIHDVDAFATLLPSDIFHHPTCPTCHVGALHLARKYIVIGGNIDGLNPNQEEDTYSMSKKERRRREREAGEANFKSGNKKKKQNNSINYDKLEEKVTRERTLLPRESKNIDNKNKPAKKLSQKAARIQKQRTAGNTVSSTMETTTQSPDKLPIEIRVAKRSNKTVTMVLGLTIPFKDRKVLLKEMKASLGGGGTLADGVIELQGEHADRILTILKSKGYSSAKVVGGKQK